MPAREERDEEHSLEDLCVFDLSTGTLKTGKPGITLYAPKLPLFEACQSSCVVFIILSQLVQCSLYSDHCSFAHTA